MAYDIDPGELTERVKLYSRTATQDAAGQDTLAWTLAVTLWAKRVPVRAAERVAAAQTGVDAVDRFIVRAGTAVDETWRLEWISGAGSPAYDIVGVTPLPGRQWLELLCRKGVKDGR